jgi:hypothetical protein
LIKKLAIVFATRKLKMLDVRIGKSLIIQFVTVWLVLSHHVHLDLSMMIGSVIVSVRRRLFVVSLKFGIQIRVCVCQLR